MNHTIEIHIVSFNIPYPPNYGGVIDVFYKLKALSELGVKIHLHCFKYDRPKSKELENYCKSVTYYDRPKSLSYFFSRKPFIVQTRSNKYLYKNLINDSFPIFFEGLHTTYFLKRFVEAKKRQIIVRTHNIEHDYYNALAKSEKNVFKKLFFFSEARKLKRYEHILESNICIAAITEKDYLYFNGINQNSIHLPAFHPFNKVDIKSGSGNYILYHGDLSVNENIEAINFIMQEIASKVSFDFKIAGRNPGKKIIELIKKYNNVELISNPDQDVMTELIQNAQINLLLTSQSTGIKLKLINALHIGRYCIVNDKMIEGTQLESLCSIKNLAKDIVEEIKTLFNKSFSEEEVQNRKQTLLKIVNNTENAQKLINLLDKN
ncbi:MAG: glycosyltransferase [Bacteroidales bacterium]|nr:glycosyltransferase [Bacteroidales bacterium]